MPILKSLTAEAKRGVPCILYSDVLHNLLNSLHNQCVQLIETLCRPQAPCCRSCTEYLISRGYFNLKITSYEVICSCSKTTCGSVVMPSCTCLVSGTPTIYLIVHHSCFSGCCSMYNKSYCLAILNWRPNFYTSQGWRARQVYV
jgi:hypothetical protein